MYRKTKIVIVALSFLLFASLLQKADSPTATVSCVNQQYYFELDSSLGFHHPTADFVFSAYLTLTVTNGTLNTTANTLTMTRDSGWFRFTSVNTTTLETDYNVTNVLVDGVKIETGDSIDITANTTRLIYWNVEMQPFLPVMFIFGMVGLGAMFGGLIYPIHLFKKHGGIEGFRVGLIFFVLIFFIGLGLFMAWVFQ